MKWIIDGTEYTDARKAADYIMENCSENYYDEMLDEVYEEIEICGYSYSASIALYRVDPTAYYCGKSDWEDSMASDLEYELERMSDGDEETFYDSDVECIEEEEEDYDEEESENE